MQKQLEHDYICPVCGNKIEGFHIVTQYNHKFYHKSCWDNREKEPKVEFKEQYNEPQHYHQHSIDTIEFLQKGFPPEVFLHFALANVVKYAQRAEYKNGLEDLDKMVDYAVRARDWYKRRWIGEETHS
jgi:hypothetical protein